MRKIKLLRKEYYVLTEEELIEVQKAIQRATVRTASTRWLLSESIADYVKACIKGCEDTDENLSEAWRIINHVE